MNAKKKNYSIIAVVLLVLVLTTAAGSINDIYFKIKKNFTIFSEVFNQIALYYVDEIDPDILVHQAIDAMLETLDPYTILIDDSQNQDIDIMTTGKYAGVGIEVGVQRGKIVVITPLEGYSAHKRGIKAGDEIIFIESIPVEQLSKEEIDALLVGEAGTTVSLTIKRYGIEQPIEFTLLREKIEIKSVPFYGIVNNSPRIAYIYLTQFNQNVAEEVRTALENITQSEPLDGLILDLRNNPGGLLSEAVRLVNIFITQGKEVVRIKSRTEKIDQVFYTQESAIEPDIPLVVLQNGGSASASEIVAGVLQDLDRALILGETSFGKGLVQTITPISYNHSLKSTTSRYYIPSGRSIQALTYDHKLRNSSDIIPDSLRKAFKTKKGRIVYDGIGIEPDINIEERKLGRMEINLMKEGHYFFFANEYVSKHDTIKKEWLNTIVFPQFETYLQKHNFDYSIRAEVLQDALIKELPDSIVSKELYNALESAVYHKKRIFMDSVRTYINEQLYKELISRYLSNDQIYYKLLENDTYTQKALELLKDRDTYRTLLKPKKR